MKRSPEQALRFGEAASNVYALADTVGKVNGPERYRIGDVSSPELERQVQLAMTYHDVLSKLGRLAIVTATFHQPVHGRRRMTERNIQLQRQEFDEARAKLRVLKESNQAADNECGTEQSGDYLRRVKEMKTWHYPFGYKLGGDIHDFELTRKNAEEINREVARQRAHFAKNGQDVSEEQLIGWAKEVLGIVPAPQEETTDDEPARYVGRHTSGYGRFLQGDINYRGRGD